MTWKPAEPGLVAAGPDGPMISTDGVTWYPYIKRWPDEAVEAAFELLEAQVYLRETNEMKEATP